MLVRHDEFILHLAEGRLNLSIVEQMSNAVAVGKCTVMVQAHVCNTLFSFLLSELLTICVS